MFCDKGAYIANLYQLQEECSTTSLIDSLMIITDHRQVQEILWTQPKNSLWPTHNNLWNLWNSVMPIDPPGRSSKVPKSCPKAGMSMHYGRHQKYSSIEHGSLTDIYWACRGLKDETGYRSRNFLRVRQRTENSLSFAKETEASQAQTVAIHHCVKEILRLETGYKHIAILITPWLIWYCALTCTTRHEDIKGNETADALGKEKEEEEESIYRIYAIYA